MEDKDIQDMLYKKVTREPLPVEVLNGQVVEQMTAKESVPLVLPNNWINKPEEPEILWSRDSYIKGLYPHLLAPLKLVRVPSLGS